MQRTTFGGCKYFNVMENLQYNQFIAELQTNRFETVHLLDNLLEICIMVSFLLSNNKSWTNFLTMWQARKTKALCIPQQQMLVIYSYESDWRIVFQIWKFTGSSSCWCQRPWQVVACWKWCMICGGRSALANLWFVKSWRKSRGKKMYQHLQKNCEKASRKNVFLGKYPSHP